MGFSISWSEDGGDDIAWAGSMRGVVGTCACCPSAPGGRGHRWAPVSQLEGVTRRQISRLRKITSKINALLKGLILMPSRQWHLAITLGYPALFLRKKTRANLA